MTSPQRTTVECFKCKQSITIGRTSVRYWPDHLWAGKVNASYDCPLCGSKIGKWAHELPEEWQSDWPNPDWETYCLPTLIDSCYMRGIKPAIFTNVLKSFEEDLAALRGVRTLTWREQLALLIAPTLRA